MSESLIISWETPRSIRMTKEESAWAEQVKAEVKASKNRRGEWALVAIENEIGYSLFKARKDAAEKAFGWTNIHWEISGVDKLYVRWPWWKLF